MNATVKIENIKVTRTLKTDAHGIYLARVTVSFAECGCRRRRSFSTELEAERFVSQLFSMWPAGNVNHVTVEK